MKLCSFNIWGGAVYKPFMDFIAELAPTTDIFCFQEVFSALPGAVDEVGGARMYLLEELQTLLPDFTTLYEPRSIGYAPKTKVDFAVSFGLAIFTRKNLPIEQYRVEILEQVVDSQDPIEGWIKTQVLKIGVGDKKFWVMNFHGVAHPGNKLDSPQRLAHTQKLKLIWDSLGKGPKILCGDFNLYPETQSVKILESGTRNLIKEYDITNTRNQLSWNKQGHTKQTYADFTFVSPSLKINSFEVPYNEVSDHLPMIMDFSL